MRVSEGETKSGRERVGYGCRAVYPQEDEAGPKWGARAVAGLHPFLGPPPSEHCLSFTNPRSMRTPDSLFILDTFPHWTLFYYFYVE